MYMFTRRCGMGGTPGNQTTSPLSLDRVDETPRWDSFVRGLFGCEETGGGGQGTDEAPARGYGTRIGERKGTRETER